MCARVRCPRGPNILEPQGIGPTIGLAYQLSRSTRGPYGLDAQGPQDKGARSRDGQAPQDSRSPRGPYQLVVPWQEGTLCFYGEGP